MNDNRMKSTFARNRLDIAPQALLLSVGVILSVVLISIMVIQFEQARKMAEIVSENMLETTERIKNSDILQYDGETLTGADVRNFCKKYLSGGDEIEKITIKNKTVTTTYTQSSSRSGINNTSSAEYVAPTAAYSCSITCNANGIITLVSFTIQ